MLPHGQGASCLLAVISFLSDSYTFAQDTVELPGDLICRH